MLTYCIVLLFFLLENQYTYILVIILLVSIYEKKIYNYTFMMTQTKKKDINKIKRM